MIRGKTANVRSCHLPSYPTAFPVSPQSAGLWEKDLARLPSPTRWQPLPVISAPSPSSNILLKADRFIQPYRDGGGGMRQVEGTGSGVRLWDKMSHTDAPVPASPREGLPMDLETSPLLPAVQSAASPSPLAPEPAYIISSLLKAASIHKSLPVTV